MYGICNHCEYQEETREAYCPECKYPWNVFPKKPKDTDKWKERKGWLNRIHRSLPPWAVIQFVVALLVSLLLLPLNIAALYEDIYISQLSGLTMWICIAVFDLGMTWLVFSSMRLSLSKFRWARIMITFNLGGTVLTFIHNWTRVIGHHVFAPAGLYLTFRLFILLYICYVIWLKRIENAILRHGSPSS